MLHLDNFKILPCKEKVPAMKMSKPDQTLEQLVFQYGGDGFLKIDLGCGFYAPKGFIGLDNMVGAASQISSENLPDIYLDLHVEKLPFNDESCVIVRSSHYLEHSNLDLTFQEVHRVLTRDGVFENVFPYALSDEGIFPGHSIFLTEKWFRENMIFQSLFTIEEFLYIKSEKYLKWPWFLKLLIPFRFARVHMFNVSNEIHLVARKRV